MQILAAFDKFKDSMTAQTACATAANAAAQALGDNIEVIEAPLTDGGEGFCPILTQVAGGKLQDHTVSGPLFTNVEAMIGWVEIAQLPSAVQRALHLSKGKLAIIEMASAAGLEQVPKALRHPKHCTTRGVGELIRIACGQNATALLLGIGGSATSDLGLGALEVLGLKFSGTDKITPEKWSQIQNIEGEIDCVVPPIYIACDVDNPLCGPTGAAKIYGPQKGLQPNEIADFDQQSAQLADQLCQHFNQSPSLKDTPGAGAAGGIGFGLKVAFGAQFIAGFELVQTWLDLENKIDEVDLILTGEGKFDHSSLAGKGPYSLIQSAAKKDKPVMLFAGKVEKEAEKALKQRFEKTNSYSISPSTLSIEEALKLGAQNLHKTVFNALRTQESE